MYYKIYIGYFTNLAGIFLSFFSLYFLIESHIKLGHELQDRSADLEFRIFLSLSPKQWIGSPVQPHPVYSLIAIEPKGFGAY